ncbi:hypothetical protein BDQ12DRAFT_713521 [Crucibulum laeve]|uniref:GST N-terminal domain-containing protein n=1 Tax=Crucibulum laeve TaxID=68775 RepID=A0A5C3LXZ5_9AGAR|nr:hypothetical protein BDQ12DRAFT_713521 [Crucibulum laeve]
MITFYDIPSALPGNAWSPNTWKTRYSLNYKEIPYKTEWVEYPDIESLCKKVGIPPTSKKKNGADHYTLPAIHDSSTGIALAESKLIAEYLEKTYPNTPKLFPLGTEALQHAFLDAYSATLSAYWQFILPVTTTRLNPPSEEYFTRTRTELFGKPLKDVPPTGEERVVEWKKLQDGFAVVNKWYEKNGRGPFIMGDTPSFADFVVGAFTLFGKLIFTEDSEEWKDIASWNEGRWVKLVDSLEKYAQIV